MRLVPVLALVLGGCILSSDEADPYCGDGTLDRGEQCDDGNNISDDGCSACVLDTVPRALRVEWSLRTATSAVPVSCPPGYDTAEVVSQNVNAIGMPIGTPTTDVFACDAGSGTVIFNAADVADVQTTVRITNGTGGTVFAESIPAIVDLSASDRDLTVAILTDGGYFKLGWLLRGETTGNELTCSTVEPDEIELVSTPTAGSFKTDKFTCADGEGLTGALPAGTYTLSVAAVANDNPLGPAATLTSQVVLDRNRITDLGVVEIPISGL